MPTKNAVSYSKASVPADFLRLLGIGSEQYCRYAWSRSIKSETRWQAIGTRSSGKPVTTLLDFKLKSESYVPALSTMSCSVDVFLSPNQFFDWRNTKQLAQLHANWLEIDTLDHAILSADVQVTIFEDVSKILRDNALPCPTGYVASGSGGLHFYWIYEGIAAYKWRVRIWREITIRLARAVKKNRKPDARWTVDYAATRDPSRVLRLPGTIHSESGRTATAYVGGPLYTFDDLAKGLVRSKQNLEAMARYKAGKLATPERSQRAPKPRPVPKAMGLSPLNGRHTIGQWWFRTYTVLCTQARLNGVKEGQRDLFAFILFVALKHIKGDSKRAFEALLPLNREFIGLDEEELRAYLKTACETHYKYRKDSLAEYLESNLGIDSSYLYDNPKAPLKSPAEVRASQRKSAQCTAQKRRDRTFNEILLAAQHLKKARMKVTQALLAKNTGRSVRTIRRYWPELIRKGSLGLSLYIPPLAELSCG
ncbi:MAG: hypothetical protein KUG76_08315 [Gammaproteobacteria bacterium]|nr:hypothetical protein [Gammaproteobacteria bacterium]